MERLENVPPCRIIKAAPPKIKFQKVPMMIGGMPVVVVVKKEVKRGRDGTFPEIPSAGVCDA